jgi:hypothetical protein
MTDNLNRCRASLDSVGNLLNAHQTAISEFQETLDSVRGFNSFLTLRDIERLIAPTARSVSIARIQKSNASSFGLISPYGVGGSTARPIENLKALAPVPVSTYAQVSSGMLMLAENYLAMFDGSQGQQRSVVAGSYSQGNVGSSRQQSRFKNPESICTFTYKDEEKTHLVMNMCPHIRCESLDF